MDGPLEDRPDMIPVLGEGAEVEVAGDPSVRQILLRSSKKPP